MDFESLNMNVSLITACKNRYKPLLISLQSWILFDEIKEIIIVDWNSDEPIDHLTKLDPRIKVIRVSDKEYFNQPQPLNLAASIATGDSILKFDVDHMLNPYFNFFEAYPVDSNTFVSGSPNYEADECISNTSNVDLSNLGYFVQKHIEHYNYTANPVFKSLFGVFHITRDNFIKCGGFNEDLGEFYGFEDEELQKRLEMLGLTHTKLNYDQTLVHIPHPDAKRLENFKAFVNDSTGVSESSFSNFGNAPARENANTHIAAISEVRNNMANYYSGQELDAQVNYAVTQYHLKRNKNYFSNPESYFIQPKTKWIISKVDDQIYNAIEIIGENQKKKSGNKLHNFPPVYYVTLEDCFDRQKQLENEFANYGISPKAIKSKRFSESSDIITGKYVYQLTGPTQGCVVSHLKAIKSWYDSEESDYAFFCEDDLSLKTVENWNFSWEEFIERLPDDCECVQLMTIRGDFDGVYFRDRKWDDWSETAYIMNRDYAKKIIDSYCLENDVFHLELKDLNVMPIGENILFTNLGKVYTFPLFVENVDIPTTDVNDSQVENDQKPNHIYSSEYISHWWEKNGKTKTIDELMGVTLPRKSFVIMEENDEYNQIFAEKPVVKTELENLLYEYSLDTENPIHNFNLGVWYENQGHTAPALSYFLRCAERAADTDKNLAYEALIRGSYCYEKQGTRDGSSRSLLWQAQMFLPNRPEAYYLLARFAERREWWQDCYSTADLSLRNCDFDLEPLKTDVEYPGKQSLMFIKAKSGWWWGKGEESRKLLSDILDNYDLDKDSHDLVLNTLKTMNG